MIFLGVVVKKGCCNYCVASTDDETCFDVYSPAGTVIFAKEVFPGEVKKMKIVFDLYAFMEEINKINSKYPENTIFEGFKFASMHPNDVAEAIERLKCLSVGSLEPRELLE